MSHLADQVATLLTHLVAGPAVLLGQSMGGAVAVQFAYEHPGESLGIINRDGVATPAWRNRHSLLTAAIAPFAPDSAPFADLMAALVLDSPDFLVGRLYSTVLSVLPDFRRNIRTMGGTLPVGSMLMNIDLRDELRSLVAQNLPILPVWGCFDRVTNTATAVEFSEAARTPVQWVPGGHSWMLARPRGQADLLAHVESGRQFVLDVEDRWRRIASTDRSLRAIS
jgi:pimeloyl-ACP methyl ester carboxylesterase